MIETASLPMVPAHGLGPGAAADTTRRELHRQVLKFVARRVSSREDAEDIAQEVLLRIHRHRGDLAHVEHVSAWVHRIAANAITDHYRRASRREVPSGQAEDIPESRPTDLDTDTAAELRRELAACLRPLLERLSPIYREALELTEFGAMSQTDAAALLGISVSGMKARVQRAREQLRGLLLACCHVELDRRRGPREVRSRGGACSACGQA